MQEVETGPPPVKAPPPPAEKQSHETGGADEVPPLRQPKSNPLWRVVAVMGTAIVLLGGWGLYGVSKQLDRGIPGDKAVWAQAKIEVADRLKAPKTAEFPKPGEIKRIRGADPPRWSVRSVVDAKNELGVPLRHHWLMEISFDTRLRKWEPEFIEIDDKRVYASEATQREDRVYAEKRDARNKAAKKEAARLKARKRGAAGSGENTPDGHGRDSPKEPARRPGSDQELPVDARRETGIWKEVVEFEGQATYQTAPFKVKFTGWRFRWACEGEATIRLLDAAKEPVDDEIDIGGGGEKGTRYVPRGTGEFSLKITTKSHWTLVVEE